MSNALICDRCTRIFPEGEEGSGRGNLDMVVRDTRGRKASEIQVMDICGQCNGIITKVPAITDNAPNLPTTA